MKLLTTIALCALVGLCAALPVAAVTHSSTLIGPLGVVPLQADADYSGGVWTYTYTADISALSRTVTGLSIGNLDRLLFSAAANNKNLTNPTYAGTDSIIWTSGTVSPGDGPVVFTMQSAYAPKLVDVTLWGNAFPSSGQTLGIGIVPEPSSFVGLALCSLGVAGSVSIRRRTRR